MLVVKGTVSMSCPHVMFSLENEKPNTIYMFFTSSHDLKMFPGMCALVEPWESFVIGVLGAIICLTGVEIVDRLKIDDPVGKRQIYLIPSQVQDSLDQCPMIINLKQFYNIINSGCTSELNICSCVMSDSNETQQIQLGSKLLSRENFAAAKIALLFIA